MKKYLKIIIPLILICITGLVIYHFVSKVKLNSSYVNGNTAGNLYNAGLFCESDGEVFFSNTNDNGRLYAMNIDGSNIHKLSNDTAMYINADKNYVYYVRNNNQKITSQTFFSYDRNSLCRIKRNGHGSTVLDPDPCIYASLIGNYIYYLHYDTQTATSLYRIRIDGEEIGRAHV